MDLILWRHAEAFDADEATEDLDRALTAKGERQAARMADWLNRRLAASTRILVSPARRAQQTAHALGRKFRTADEIGPAADATSLLAAARWPDGGEPVLLVGHQPALGQVAATLLGAPAGTSWTLKKAAVWWLRQRERDGDGRVLLQAVQSPDLL